VEVAFTLAPAGIIMFAVFSWHLWLSPAALAYESAKAAMAVAISPTIVPQPKYGESTRTDWAPWKLMPAFQIEQLAKIIALDDPANYGELTTAAYSYRQLIFSGN